MVTSSNGNIFCVTGHLCGEFTGPVNSSRKGQWRRALMFSVICVWINDWVNNREAGGLRRYHAHCDVIVMLLSNTWKHTGKILSKIGFHLKHIYFHPEPMPDVWVTLTKVTHSGLAVIAGVDCSQQDVIDRNELISLHSTQCSQGEVTDILSLYVLNWKMYIQFIKIPPNWHDTGSTNTSSWKTRTCLFYIISIMGADVRVTQGARASATRILT